MCGATNDIHNATAAITIEATTVNIIVATAAITIVDPVPSCIPQWSGWGPRDSDTSGTFLDCSEASGS